MDKAIYKILIVEDEKLFQDLLIDYLSKDSIFQIYTANNGREGLETALNRNPDIILLDIRMPIMDGITMMKEMKKSEQLKNIPIIFLTSVDPDEEIINEITREKPAYYLIKNKMNINDIGEKIRETLSMRH